jgi:EpsI family protein
MTQRAFILSVVLLLVAAGVRVASRSESVPVREELGGLSMQVGNWQGASADRFDQQVLAVLGVDDYLNRVYQRPGDEEIGFYVGYYRSQREGSKLHSPLVCLPGAGWETQQRQLQAIEIAGPAGRRTITVNRLLVAKGLSKQVVLYWYQSQGRVIANEYWGKYYSLVDAIRNRRTDTAIVRVVNSVAGSDAAAEARAERAAIDFARTVFPLLSRYVPD